MKFLRKKRRSTLIGYVPGDSLLHRLDPRTKLLAIVFIGIASLSVASPVLMAVPLIFVVLLVAISHLGRQLFRSLLAFSLILAVVLVLDAFFSSVEPGNLVLSLDLGLCTLDLYSGRLNFALAMGLRLLTIASISLLFIMTTDYSAFVRSLKAMHVPNSISFSLGYALRSAATMWEDAHHIADAQRSRGLEFDRSLLTKNRNRLMALTVPIAVSVLNRSSRVSESMLSRGFGYSQRPSFYDEPRFGRCDVFMILGLCAMLASEYAVAVFIS